MTIELMGHKNEHEVETVEKFKEDYEYEIKVGLLDPDEMTLDEYISQRKHDNPDFV